MNTITKEPFGTQPKPVTGRCEPDLSDPTLAQREANAYTTFKTIWIDHDPQVAAMNQLRAYRLQTLGRKPGVPLSGRRLSQETQAGKSALAERLKFELAQERAAEGLPPNEFQIIIITIDKMMTLKNFYQEILKEMKDDHYVPVSERDPSLRRTSVEDRRSYKVLEQRISEWVLKLGVEIIVADEAQRLDQKTEGSSAVTDRIQTFLDRGVVPLVLIGNGKSHRFFEKNQDLSARLGSPIELKRLDPAHSAKDARDFKKFCKSFDEALVRTGIFPSLAELDSVANLDAFLAVSKGHIGRVARLIEEALLVAVRREAAHIERFDLSVATRAYAIKNDWVDHDPFSE